MWWVYSLKCSMYFTYMRPVKTFPSKRIYLHMFSLLGWWVPCPKWLLLFTFPPLVQSNLKRLTATVRIPYLFYPQWEQNESVSAAQKHLSDDRIATSSQGYKTDKVSKMKPTVHLCYYGNRLLLDLLHSTFAELVLCFISKETLQHHWGRFVVFAAHYLRAPLSYSKTK